MLLYLRVKCRLALEELKVCRRYYSNQAFRLLDRALRKAYRFKNPYTLSRKFLKKKGEQDIHLYGETYLTTYEKIGKACRLTAKDRVLELGCGRGRGVFFLSRYFGATVHGVEWIPQFVHIAQSIATAYSSAHTTFACEDFMYTDLKDYTVIYLFGTCLKDAEVERLIRRFQILPKGVKIVTVSYPLTQYRPSFTIQKEFSALFPWGEARIYIQEVS